MCTPGRLEVAGLENDGDDFLELPVTLKKNHRDQHWQCHATAHLSTSGKWVLGLEFANIPLKIILISRDSPPTPRPRE